MDRWIDGIDANPDPLNSFREWRVKGTTTKLNYPIFFSSSGETEMFSFVDSLLHGM